jgi:hypothetical protein
VIEVEPEVGKRKKSKTRPPVMDKAGASNILSLSAGPNNNQAAGSEQSSLELSRDPDSIYQTHVLQRTRDTTKLDILNHQVPESVFVECFKPGGYMSSAILYLQCELWQQEWTDKLILSQKAVVSTFLILFLFIFFSYP